MKLYFRLAAGGIRRNSRLYVPYIMTCSLMVMMYYITDALSGDEMLSAMRGGYIMHELIVIGKVVMALFAIFISYNMFGRNYGAAVMAAGNCGWGCGSGPNAVANEKAVMDQYGWHNVAWVLYPSFAVIIDDIYNPIFLSVFGGLLAH